MSGITGCCARFAVAFVLLLTMGFQSVRAQDSLEDIKYKEDYDRVQTILKVTDILKRGDRIVSMYFDRRDMNEQIRTYLDSIFVRDMEALMKQQNFAALRRLSEGALKARPRFGEMYLFQGIALKNEKKPDEAMVSFARGFAIKNQKQNMCKQQLDLLYRATHNGSLVGQEKLIKEAMKDMK